MDTASGHPAYAIYLLHLTTIYPDRSSMSIGHCLDPGKAGSRNPLFKKRNTNPNRVSGRRWPARNPHRPPGRQKNTALREIIL